MGGRPLSRSTELVLYGFVVAAFLVLAWRTEVNAQRLYDDARERMSQRQAMCEERNKNIDTLNAFYANWIALEQADPLYLRHPDFVDARVELLEQAKLRPYDCGAVQ